MNDKEQNREISLLMEQARYLNYQLEKHNQSFRFEGNLDMGKNEGDEEGSFSNQYDPTTMQLSIKQPNNKDNPKIKNQIENYKNERTGNRI